MVMPKGTAQRTEDTQMWGHGKMNGYHNWVKYYSEGSEHGIGGDGKVSKLSIRKDGKELYRFERGLDFDNLDAGGKAVYEDLLRRYN